MRSRRDMDVSFTNVLEGARQYFQGLPAPNTTTPSEGRIYDEQSSSGNSVSAEDGRESNSSKISEAYWSTGGDLRTIEPYPPQPTRVEVPDTRPNDGGSNRPDSPASLTSLTEMQPPSRPHSSRQDPQQMEPSNSNSPAPVYQQLNNVSRPSSYPRPAEMLNTNSHYSMATSERPPSTPIVAQRTQYYPRYHHPDITKSAPVPFSQNSIYQSPQTSISSATEPPRPTPIIEPESSPAHQVPSHSSAYQPTHHPAGAYRLNRPLQQLQQQQQHHHNQQQPQQQQQQHHQQQQQQQSPTDISSMHSSSNPCSPRHAQQSHIPSPHNHPGHIPSPHLPVPSVAPPSSLSSAHALPQQPNHHTSRVNPTHVTTSNSTYSTSRVALSNPYQNQGSVATTNQNHHHHHQQQMLPPPSGYQQSVSPHDLNRHENSPQRQSPHVSVVHNTISPQNLTNFQPHSPTYPPPPQPPQPPHPYGGHRATYPTPYPTSSYHSYQKTPHTNVYPQASRSYGQLPVAGPTPQPPPTLNPPSASPSNDANGVSYSHHHASSKLSSYNGVDPKRTVIPASQANSHGSYRMPVNVQRNTNTHNLPITAVSSYHSNRGSRETVAKVQAIPRPRTQLVPNTSVSTAPLVMSPRMPEYHQERFPIATSAGPNYTAYSSQYRNYATTVAPSHHGSTSTTVTSIVNDTRPSQPSAVTVHTRPSSDTSRRSMYTTQRLDNYSYKEYSYANSSSSQGSQGSQPVSTVAPRQPVQMNGLPIRKRESPLDLSVKTVKTSADSTARDDFDASDKVSSSSLGTSRNRMLPPSQPGVTPYGSYDGRNSNGARNPTPSLRPATPQMPVCAPKVDFLPDFNNAPLRHQSNHQPESNLRRSTSQQIYVPPQHSSNTPLPHMSTFKKTSLPSTPVYENKPGLTSYPAMIEAPRQQIRYPTANPVQARPPTLQDYESKYLDSRGKYPHDRNSMKRPGEPFYLPGGSSSNKHPRIDTWKIAIDKEIQQRLTAAQAIHEQHKRHEMTLPSPLPNGTLVSPGYPHQIPQQRPENSSQQNPNRYPMPICDKKNNSEEKSRESMMTYSSHAMSKSPSSQVSQGLLQPVCQAPYPYRPSQRSLHAQQPHDIPSNTGADKRVLSLLRNSLESKQQREEQLNSQQPLLVNHSQPSFQNKVVAPVEPKTNIGRHNLSPFTAASLLERNSNTPPHYKFHVPRAVDSITQEMPRSLYGSRVNSSASLPAGKEALLGPRDLEIHRDKDDSLAAILAAKIRTKAELKQVGTGQFTSKPVFLPSQDVADSERAASTSTPQSAASSAGSPPKLTREKTPSLLPRRRLFSRSEEENMPVAATVPAPAAIVPAASVVSARTSGFRSSSETSVFDFRESDSEGEMPVLERQTLEEMRRDRKQLSKVQPPVSLNDAMCVAMASSEDLVKIELKENDKVPELDPFWAATCDKFIEQLRNGGEKKRGRRKKIEEPEETSKESESKIQIQITPENIKKEIDEDDAMMSNQNKNSDASGVEKMDPNKVELTIKKELEEDEGECNNSEHDSDELPLIKRASKKKAKKDGDDSDGDDIIPKKRQIKRGSRIKLESSSGSDSSSEDSDGSGEFGHGSSVAHRLRARKRSGTGSIETEGMKLRSREMLPQKGKHEKESKTPMKNTAVQKPKPKPLFGDGSDFRPGWEEEVYVYKKSLRMPTRLINVSKPSRFHRLSTSLPDLDPGSPALSVSMDSTDVCLQKRDSDLESNCSFGKIEDEEATSSTTISLPPKTRQTRSDTNSIVDVLAKKVGSSKKDTKKKLKEKLEKSGSKVISKGSNEPELLPTPSLTPLLTNETKSKATGKSLNKNNKTANPINMIDSYLLGYFRKETVNNFRDTFKNNHALPNEFSTYVLKSRTRTETRVLKKQATIREVFGEDRPASAPPMQNHAGDTSQDDDSQTETKESLLGKPRTLRQKVVSRLRNASILRSHKAIINSKRHLLTVQRRKVLLKSLTEKKLKNLKKESKDGKKTGEPDQEADAVADELDADNNDETERPSKKKLKLRSGRRKFRSGFDYIRKKKKPMKKDDTVVPKERKRVILRPNAECVADIQTEIRTWVIKKGVGETILHRAARLGYTDVTAYCLEKLNNAPSPKDNAGYTPLHEACSRGHLEIAKLLLAYGANVSESANGGIRPLHEAAENGATELVRLLLSYGADPLLATYSGQTPLMLAVDTDAYSIIEQHLGDVQGHSTTSWTFRGPSSIFDPEETGYDPMAEVPASNPEPELSEIEMEISEINLPVLFSLTNDPDKWVLQSDLMAALRVKSRDALLRQINPKAPSGPPTVAHRDVMKELKLHDFLEQSRCCHLLSAGERINVRASKVALIKYNDKVKSLLNVEHVVINLS